MHAFIELSSTINMRDFSQDEVKLTYTSPNMQIAQYSTSHREAGKICLFFSYQCRSTTFPACDCKTKSMI